ncbi:MAG TPA: Clp protease N-terminal domain-containing protein [Pseudonocardiaceae bacterium]|nr:Clp protease N-terminal domain-containing protein [Pseudonocardiaceae bacterium]
MFERLTTDARRVILPLAQRQARHWPMSAGDGKPVIGAVHFLLAVARDQHGQAGKVLRAHGITEAAVQGQLRDRVSDVDADALATLGIDLVAVREAAEATFGPGALDLPGSAHGKVGFGSSGKQVLVNAVRAAVATHSNQISTEHLLHGVLRTGDGTVSEILTALNVDQDGLGVEVAALIGPAAA